MEWIILIVSFLGGGVVSAVITQYWNLLNENEKEKRKYIEKQLQSLYGPLCHYIFQSEVLFGLNDKLQEAHKAVFSSYNNPSEGVIKEATDTINLANEYINIVRVNNKNMIDILDKNYSYIDPDDIDIFKLFYEHYIRMEKEFTDKGMMKAPWQIYKEIGNVSHLRPEVIKRVKEKFMSKKEKIVTK